MGADSGEKDYGLFKKRLKRGLQLHGPLRDLGAQFNRKEGYFYNVINDEAKLPVRLLFKLCDDLDVPLAAVMPTGGGTFDDPVRILRSQRERPTVPADPFFDEIEPRILALFESGVDRQAPCGSERALLEALEEQRHGDRLATQEATELLALRLVGALEAGAEAKPHRQVAELAGALALWGTLQRMRGFRDLAVRAFGLAFPVARHSRDPWAIGICFQRAAYVLADLDRPDLGYQFLGHAIFFFSGEESPLNTWKCHMDCGALLGADGRIEDSNAAYELALERLPGSEWRFRACSLQGLGINARKAGHLDKARDFLIAAAKECRHRDLFVGQISWSLAKLEAALNNDKASVKLFQEAIGLLGRFGSAGDVALASVDFVEVLLKMGRNDQVLGLATQVAEWLPTLRANPVLRRSFDKLVDLVRAARLEQSALEATRKQIELACRQDLSKRSAAEP